MVSIDIIIIIKAMNINILKEIQDTIAYQGNHLILMPSNYSIHLLVTRVKERLLLRITLDKCHKKELSNLMFDLEERQPDQLCFSVIMFYSMLCFKITCFFTANFFYFL